MTISATARTALPLGVRPAGTPVGTKISSPTIYSPGDSNWYDQGFSLDNTGNSARLRLDQKLRASGITPTWVGNQVSGTAPADHHRGIAGSTYATHRSTQVNDSVTYVAALAPHLAIIPLGTNDCATDAGRDNFVTNAVGFITELMAAHANLRRFVIFKMYPVADPTSQARLDVINDTHIASVKSGAEAAGALVVVADLRLIAVKGHLRASESTAAKHIQSQDGFELIASVMFPAVVNACGYNAVWVGDQVA